MDARGQVHRLYGEPRAAVEQQFGMELRMVLALVADMLAHACVR